MAFVPQTGVSGFYGWGRHHAGQLANHVDEKTVNDSLKDLTIACKAGFAHTLVLTAQGKVLAFGTNKLGQCGQGDTAVAAYTNPVEIEAFSSMKIVDIACGTQFSAAVSDTGQLFSWGYDGRAQLGRQGNHSIPLPLNVFGLKVVQVDCGNDHALCCTSEGHCYSWGRGTEGQLGFGEGFDYSLPRRVETEVYVSRVAAGAHFSVVLSRTGHVMSFGDLGIATNEPYLEPVPSRVISIATGSTHALALAVDGVYAWGGNRCGQCGIPGGLQSLREPTLVGGAMAGQHVASASGGLRHSVFVTDLGEVYTCGQLDPDGDITYTPRLALHEKNIYLATAGGEHSLAFINPQPRLAKLYRRFCAQRPLPFGDCVRESDGARSIRALEARDPSVSLPAHLERIRLSGKYSDVCFLLEGGFTFQAHRFVLAARGYLKDERSAEDEERLEEEEDDASEEVAAELIALPAFEGRVFEWFLRWLYTDISDFPADCVFEMMAIAAHFKQRRLLHICEALVLWDNDIDVSFGNSSYVYAVAKRCHAQRLASYCLRLMAENFESLEESGFVGLNDEEIVKVRLIRFGPEGKPPEVEPSILDRVKGAVKGAVFSKLSRLEAFRKNLITSPQEDDADEGAEDE